VEGERKSFESGRNQWINEARKNMTLMTDQKGFLMRIPLQRSFVVQDEQQLEGRTWQTAEKQSC
jgi:hypothetical protein